MNELHDKVLSSLQNQFPDAVNHSGDERDFPVFHIEKKDLMAVLAHLKKRFLNKTYYNYLLKPVVNFF